jgi:hypothetical protein
MGATRCPARVINPADLSLSSLSLSLLCHRTEHRHTWCAQRHCDQRCSPMTVANLNCIIALDHNHKEVFFYLSMHSRISPLPIALSAIGSDKLFQSARVTLLSTTKTQQYLLRYNTNQQQEKRKRSNNNQTIIVGEVRNFIAIHTWKYFRNHNGRGLFVLWLLDRKLSMEIFFPPKNVYVLSTVFSLFLFIPTKKICKMHARPTTVFCWRHKLWVNFRSTWISATSKWETIVQGTNINDYIMIDDTTVAPSKKLFLRITI